jgi:hypothetical protein
MSRPGEDATSCPEALLRSAVPAQQRVWRDQPTNTRGPGSS